MLDEADRMFDLGFISDIRYLLRRMPRPEKRRNMLFSATLSYRVMELAYEHMNSPTLVRINPDKLTVDKVSQVLYHVANDEKVPLLLGLLKSVKPNRSIVFVNTKRVAERVWSYLAGNDGAGRGPVRRCPAKAAAASIQRLQQRRFEGGWSPPTWPRAACISRM